MQNDMYQKGLISSFTVAVSKIIKIVKLHSLRTISICGDDGSAGTRQATRSVAGLNGKVSDFAADSIFHDVKIGLFLKLHLRKTHEDSHSHSLPAWNMELKNWSSVTKLFICRFWIKSLMLPPGMVTGLIPISQTLGYVFNNDDLKAVVSQPTPIMEITRHSFYDHVRDVYDEPTIQRWLNI